MTKKTQIAVSCGVFALLGVGTVATVYQTRRANESARARLTYQADGYGTFAPKSAPAAPVRAASKPSVTPSPAASVAPVASATPVSDLLLARSAYASGDFKAAEVAAKKVIADARASNRKSAIKRSVSVASAQHIMAFSAARQGDLNTARERFAEAREEAEALPKASPSPPTPGEAPQPTLAEDSAYQHAACTMGLGDNAGAERELVQFMRDFPESPLVHGAMRRIAKMHGGDIPKDVEAVWKSARVIQRKTQEKRERLAAMCGPEVVEELLRQNGKTVSVESLAKEMNTDGTGSTFAAMQKAMRNHGFDNAQGVRLTPKGLKQQELPVIALIQPGHFVLVEKIDSNGAITFWDSSERFGSASTQDKKRTASAREWQQIWSGTALTTARMVGRKSVSGNDAGEKMKSENGKQTL